MAKKQASLYIYLGKNFTSSWAFGEIEEVRLAGDT